MSHLKTFRRSYLRWHVFFALLFAVGLLAFFLMPRLPHRCPFQLLFRIYCPGCGGTRALEALLAGDPSRAFLLNPPLCFLLLLLVFGEISSLAVLLRKDVSLLQAPIWRVSRNLCLLLFILGTILHFLLRNLLLLWGIDPLGDLSTATLPLMKFR